MAEESSTSPNLFQGPPKIVWALLGAFFLLVFFGGIAGGIPGITTPSGEAAPVPPTSGAANLAQCSFSGASGNLKVGNPTLADIVSDVSTKVGVPGPVVMGILRIESVPSFTSKDPNYLASDHDATQSSAGAVGIAQFLPGTFEGIFRANRQDIFQKFQKDKVSAAIEAAVIPPPNDNTMRITSVRDSIIMAAYKTKNDKDFAVGNAALWDEQAAKAVARAYYGGCLYEGAKGNYCDDLAQSFSNCKTPSVSLADASQIGRIALGIQNSCNYTGIAGVVATYNLSCLNSVTPPLPAVVDNQIRTSALSHTFLQCVGFVKGIISWMNNETLNDHNVANAYDYQYIPPAGYRFVPKTDNNAIMIGDIAIWNNAPNGHVAVVAAVDSNNRFTIAEASWGVKGQVNMNRIIDRLSEPGFQGWARKL